jgi:hypothetical protein
MAWIVAFYVAGIVSRHHLNPAAYRHHTKRLLPGIW